MLLKNLFVIFIITYKYIQVLGTQIPIDFARIWSRMAPSNHLVHHSRGSSKTFIFFNLYVSWLPLTFETSQKLQYLREQAAVIKLFEEKFTSIWENVIILAKEGKEDTKQSFQVQEKCDTLYFS